MQVDAFSEIEQEFIERVHRMVWCSAATLDTKDRPRSRIVHTIWEKEGPVGWVSTRRTSLKAKHLEHSPYVSLAYIADIAKPVYVNCRAEWVDDLEQKQRIWNMFKEAPEPLGYDMGPIFQTVDNPNYGLLKFTPWRIEIWNFPGGAMIWQP